jgi:malate permease and related proteins
MASPPFLALLVAFALRPIGLPDVVRQVVELLGAAVVPLAMVSIGMRLRLDVVTHRPAVLATGLVLRMAVAPALVLGAAVVLGAHGTPAWEVSIVQSAMPPMVTAAVIAVDAGLDERLAVALAGIGVAVAMASLPLWALVA